MSVSYTIGIASVTKTAVGGSANAAPATATLSIPITEELTAAQLAGVERPVVIALKCTRYDQGNANYTYAYEGEYCNLSGAYGGYDVTNHTFRYSWPIFFDANTNTIPFGTSKKIIDTYVAFLIFNPTKHEQVVVSKTPTNIPAPDQTIIDSFNPWRS